MKTTFEERWKKDKLRYSEDINKWLNEKYNEFYHVHYTSSTYIQDVANNNIIRISDHSPTTYGVASMGMDTDPYKYIYVQDIKDFRELKSIIKKIIEEYEAMFDDDSLSEDDEDNAYVNFDILYDYAKIKYGDKYEITEGFEQFTIKNGEEKIVCAQANNLAFCYDARYRINILDFVMVEDARNKLDEIMKKYEEGDE